MMHPREAYMVDSPGGRSWFFPGAALVMALVMFLGFAPTFYLRGFVPGANLFPLPGHVKFHGVVMTLWYLLFAIQAMLARMGRNDFHQRLGLWGGALAVGMVVSSVDVLLHVVPRLEAAGLPVAQQIEMFRMDRVVIGGLCNLIAFTVLLLAALLLRRQGASHKRLMYWAFSLNLGAALNANRIFGAWVASWWPSGLPVIAVWAVLALVLHDLWWTRRVHWATAVGALVMLAVWGAERLISESASGRAFVLSLANPG